MEIEKLFSSPLALGAYLAALSCRLSAVDQEVGGSSPPSCTSKINDLSRSAEIDGLVA